MKPKKNESKNIKQNQKPKECKTERQKSPTLLLQVGNRCDQQSHGQPVCFLTHSRTHYPLCKQQASLLPTSPDQQAPASVHASKDSVLEPTGSHFHLKTVDTQRYTTSPVCKLQYAFICIWYSINRYWLSTYHMLGAVLGAGDTAVMKVKKSSWILIFQTCYVIWYMTLSTVFLMLPLVVYFSHLNFMKARRHPHSFI